jgi:hypothetical protein
MKTQNTRSVVTVVVAVVAVAAVAAAQLFHGPASRRPSAALSHSLSGRRALLTRMPRNARARHVC